MSFGEAQRDRHNLARLGDTPPPGWLTPESIASVEAAEQLPFSEEEYEGRGGRVRGLMSDAGVEAVIVFRPSSVEYLCGYHTAETIPQPLLLTQSDTFLYVPDLEVGRALASSCARNVLYYGYINAEDGPALVAEHAGRILPRGARVAVELGHTSTPPQIGELLRKEGVEVVHGNYLVESARLALSPAEIQCVEEAAISTQRGVEAAVDAAREPGATDSSVAAAIAAALFQNADAPSAWGPIVATGQRAGIPHSTWKLNPLSDGTTFLEFAGAHHRYHAPVMRTLSRGRLPAQAARLADLSKAALAAVLDSARAGVPCAEVAHRATEALGRLEHHVIFHYIFGYPVGLAHPPHWMDGAPFYITTDNPELLREGMVFHMPGSFRSFGSGGVGLSQTFLVEKTGARVLTHGAAEIIQL